MKNTGDGGDLFDEKVARVFQERPGPMPELREATDEAVELGPESLDLIQAAGDMLPLPLRRFIKPGQSPMDTTL